MFENMFENAIDVKTSEGIGVVTNPRKTDIPRGLYVLFSNPPTDRDVTCVSYDIRTSKKGKNYIKCFQYVPTDAFHEFKSLINNELIKEKIEEILLNMPEKYRRQIRDFLISGKVTTNEIIFYSGKIPLREYNDNIYIAVVDENGIYEYGDVHYDLNYIKPDNVLVLKNRYKVMGQLVKIGGEEYIIVRDKKLSKFISFVEKLNLNDEIKEKIIDRFMQKFYGGEKE